MVTKRGYRINRKDYLAHRVAWFLTHGNWPISQIDHIDGNRANNRLANLREATSKMNSCNRPRHREGRLVGASFIPKRKMWQSYIHVDGKIKHLGNFRTEQEAHEVSSKALTTSQEHDT